MAVTPPVANFFAPSRKSRRSISPCTYLSNRFSSSCGNSEALLRSILDIISRFGGNLERNSKLCPVFPVKSEVVLRSRDNLQSLSKVTALFLVAAAVFLLSCYAAAWNPAFLLPQPWTCVGLLAGGSCLAITLSRRTDRTAEVARIVLAAFVFLIGFIDWTEFLTGRDLGLDTLLFAHALPVSQHPGRPASATGFNLLATGIALLLYRSRKTISTIVCEAAAITSFTFCYLHITGSLLRRSVEPGQREGMVLSSSVLFVFIAGAILLSRPEGKIVGLWRSRGAAGILSRWLMPVPLVLPVLSGLIRKSGTALGLFDSAAVGSIISFLNILCALFIVWGASGQVLRLDRLRQKAEKDLRDSYDDLERQVRLRTQELVLSNDHLKSEIGERHRAENELQIANGTLNNLIDASPLAICAFNTDGSVRKSNTAADTLFASDRLVFEPLLERANRGEVLSGVEVSRATSAGSVIYQFWASPLTSGDGERNGTLVLAADVSERKAFDAKLLQTQKLESLGVLAGGIAHDFNNLLTGIMGNTSLLMELHADDPRSASMLQQVLRASQRAADLTSQMLAYAGKGKFVLAPVDLSAVVREIAALIQSSVSKQVRLRFDLDGDLPLMEMDPSQIQQVVMNLVMNATEAIPVRGEVLITTAVKHLDVDFIRRELKDSDLPPGRYVSLAVCDTGIGMDEETMARIFEPFFTTKFTGRGLGLAAVHGIMRGHRGGLTLHSVPGEGSTFQLFFPAFQDIGKAGKKKAPAPSVKAAQGLVLVVDNELLVRQIAANTLKMLGYRAEVAESGEEALRKLPQLLHELDAVLLDLTMPGWDGRETFVRLKQVAPHIPVLVSSGYDELEAERSFQGMPFDGFLQKPYTASQLNARLDAVLEKTLL